MSKPGLNLDVEAPDKVAGVLRAAADAYQQRAEEEIQAQLKAPEQKSLTESTGSPVAPE